MSRVDPKLVPISGQAEATFQVQATNLRPSGKALLCRFREVRGSRLEGEGSLSLRDFISSANLTNSGSVRCASPTDGGARQVEVALSADGGESFGEGTQLIR